MWTKALPRRWATGVPVSVAGLPDGGAAFTTVGGPDGPQVIERESASAPWQASPTPLPGSTAGQVALFREGGALRAIVSAGGISNESEPLPPAPGISAELSRTVPADRRWPGKRRDSAPDRERLER